MSQRARIISWRLLKHMVLSREAGWESNASPDAIRGEDLDLILFHR